MFYRIMLLCNDVLLKFVYFFHFFFFVLRISENVRIGTCMFVLLCTLHLNTCRDVASRYRSGLHIGLINKSFVSKYILTLFKLTIEE